MIPELIQQTISFQIQEERKRSLDILSRKIGNFLGNVTLFCFSAGFGMFIALPTVLFMQRRDAEACKKNTNRKPYIYNGTHTAVATIAFTTFIFAGFAYIYNTRGKNLSSLQIEEIITFPKFFKY